MRVPSISELVTLSDEVIKCGLAGDIAMSRKRYDRLRVLRSRIDLTIASTVGLRASSAEQNDSYLSLDHKKIEVVHLEKNTIWDLLQVEENIGVTLTESLAMWPAAAVSGYYFAHPDARYFGLGKIKEDQLLSYSKRRKISLDEARKWLNPNLIED